MGKMECKISVLSCLIVALTCAEEYITKGMLRFVTFRLTTYQRRLIIILVPSGARICTLQFQFLYQFYIRFYCFGFGAGLPYYLILQKAQYHYTVLAPF
jgi:hypothetical protein